MDILSPRDHPKIKAQRTARQTHKAKMRMARERVDELKEEADAKEQEAREAAAADNDDAAEKALEEARALRKKAASKEEVVQMKEEQYEPPNHYGFEDATAELQRKFQAERAGAYAALLGALDTLDEALRKVSHVENQGVKFTPPGRGLAPETIKVKHPNGKERLRRYRERLEEYVEQYG